MNNCQFMQHLFDKIVYFKNIHFNKNKKTIIYLHVHSFALI